MATTLQILESPPAAYPDIPGLPDTIDAATVWARLEGWIAHRWGERDCVFISEGPGDWRPPLQPFSTLTIEIWEAGDWVSAVIPPSPLGGYCLESIGPFRFTGTLGADDDPPAIVLEAAWRLGAYLATVAARDFENIVVTKETSDEVDSFEYGSPNVAARAMQYSGAADLLRRFRRPPGAEAA
jgi:hypothetical protein